MGHVLLDREDVNKTRSFKMHVRQANLTFSHIPCSNNNKTLSKQILCKRMQAKYLLIRTMRSKNYYLAKRLARSKVRKQKLHAKIAAVTEQGDLSAVIEIFNLNRAYEKGCLKGESNTLKFLRI